MKYFIIITHILIGLLLVFLNANNLLHLANLATQSTDKQYYHGISLTQGFAEAILGVILGLASIVCAVEFRKDKRWTWPALPIVTLFTMVAVFRELLSAQGLVAGPYALVAIVLLTFLISEITYLTLRKQTQSN